MATLASQKSLDWNRLLSQRWLLVLGIAVTVLPTLFRLSQQAWSQESGVHGPIVLATGLWLIARRLPDIPALIRPVRLSLVVFGVVVAIPAYIFGRAYDFISLEAAALLLVMMTVAYAYVGPVVVRMMWFPILYLCFMVPIPGWLLDVVTQPLKLFVSEVVTHGLALAGYPVARLGVTIYVASYQLLVEDACAGLNSLVSLSAIGLFYVYMLRGSNWRYSILLLALVVPIAIAANCVRVAALVLLTYHAGDAVAQGYLHNFAGMVTFTSALLFIFLVDRLLTPVRDRLARKA